MEIWIAKIMPILNAAGVPVLSVLAFIMLLRAYHGSIETYKESIILLKEENDRLRKHLSDVDEKLFSQSQKVNSIVSTSIETIEKLENLTLSALSKSQGASASLAPDDIQKIDKAIELLQELSTIQSNLKATVVRDVASTELLQEIRAELKKKVEKKPGKFTSFLVTAVNLGEKAGLLKKIEKPSKEDSDYS